jgi:hypothetical protein
MHWFCICRAGLQIVSVDRVCSRCGEGIRHRQHCKGYVCMMINLRFDAERQLFSILYRNLSRVCTSQVRWSNWSIGELLTSFGKWNFLRCVAAKGEAIRYLSRVHIYDFEGASELVLLHSKTCCLLVYFRLDDDLVVILFRVLGKSFTSVVISFLDSRNVPLIYSYQTSN